MKTLHRFGPMLLAACFVSTPAIAQEDLDDRLLINCEIRHRDSTTQADGTYRVAFVSSHTNTASGNTDDLRLQWTSTSPASRRKFSMVWQGHNTTNGNQWFITPDYAAKCMSTLSNYVHAKTCTDTEYSFLTLNDGYYVISWTANNSQAWRAPTDSNGTGYVTYAQFNATDTLATRRRFHWTITRCTDSYGNGVSPAA